MVCREHLYSLTVPADEVDDDEIYEERERERTLRTVLVIAGPVASQYIHCAWCNNRFFQHLKHLVYAFSDSVPWRVQYVGNSKSQ